MGGQSSKEKQAAAVRRRDANGETSALCNKQLRDPLTLAISFMVLPGQFRGVCSFALECWDHARYLEVTLACSLGLVEATKCSFPLTLQCLDQLRDDTDGDCTLTFASETSRRCKEATRTRKVTRSNAASVSRLVLQHDDLQSAGTCWLFDCKSLKSVEFVDLPQLTTVGFSWLQGCTSLEAVAFEHLPRLQSVGGQWLRDCKSLKVVVFVDLHQLTTAGSHWLECCTSLESATFERLSKLRTVGSHWLYDCNSLKSVSFVDLPELRSVGFSGDSRWLRGCHRLADAAFERIPNLKATQAEMRLPAQCKVIWNLQGDPGLE